MTPIIITLGILISSKQGRINSGTDLGTGFRGSVSGFHTRPAVRSWYRNIVFLTLLHSERPKLHKSIRILAVLSAIGLKAEKSNCLLNCVSPDHPVLAALEMFSLQLFALQALGPVVQN